MQKIEALQAELKKLSREALFERLNGHQADLAGALRSADLAGYSQDADCYWEQASQAEILRDLCLDEAKARGLEFFQA